MKKLLLIFLGIITIQTFGQTKLKFKPLHFGYEDHYENSLIYNTGKLYTSPDTNSKIIWQQKKPFTHRVKPAETGKNQGEKWYKVVISDTLKGFIRYQDFVKYSFSSHTANYYVVDEKEANGQSNFKIITKRKQSIDTFTVGMPAHYLRVRSDYTMIALPHVKKLFNFEFFNAQCPGTTINLLIVDCGDSLTKVANSFSMGESTWSESFIVYIPVKFGNGKILLVANGDVKNIFNGYTAELNIFPYPKNINVPIEELVVIVTENKDAEELENIDNDNEPELKVTLYKEEYYQWKDNKLSKVKEK